MRAISPVWLEIISEKFLFSIATLFIAKRLREEFWKDGKILTSEGQT